MAERGRPEGAQGGTRETSPSARRDPGDAVPPGVAVSDEREEESGRSAAERDPGDAVPPGVAPLEPPEPTGRTAACWRSCATFRAAAVDREGGGRALPRACGRPCTRGC